MPSVASEAKTYALNPPSPPVPTSLPASDRAAPSPFESLLDDGARDTPPPAPQSLPDARETAKSDASKADQPTAASEQNKAAKPPVRVKTADAGKPGKADKPATTEAAKIDTTEKTDETGKIVAEFVTACSNCGDDTTAADGKIIDGKSDGDGKTKTDGKKTDTKTDTKPDSTTDTKIDAEAAAALTPPNTVNPAVVAAAVNTAPAPAPVDPVDPAPAPSKDAAIVTTPVLTPAPVAAAVTEALAPAGEAVKSEEPAAQQADAVSAETPKGKPAALLPAQANAGKSADETDETKAPAKDAQSAQGGEKLQAAADNSDKQAIAHARGETPANSHRASIADTPQPAANVDVNATAAKPGADVTQTLAVNPPPHNAAATAANAAPAAAPALQLAAQAPVPLAGVAIAIAGKALEGMNHFEIRLDPPELGRIEVRLDVDRDGQVTSHLIAHRADTLDLLRRDAAGLQRALQDAGLKTADNGLQFSLHDQSTGRQQGPAGTKTAQLVVQDETPNAAEPTPSGYVQLARLRGGLDIRV